MTPRGAGLAVARRDLLDLRPTLTYEATAKSVQDVVNYYTAGQLELNPPFQRDSVWTMRDREKLIESLVNGYPLPAIYLNERTDAGGIVYDVIDGKQRIETILIFMGRLWGRGRFAARVDWPANGGRVELTWRRMVRDGTANRVLAAKLPTHVVRGELADVVDLFVRINSTGKALTSAEKRHARYNKSEFLRAAERTANRLIHTFEKHRVFSEGQIVRMKHVEFLCELMLAIHRGEVQNRKAALDGVMNPADALTARQVRKAKERTVRGINLVLRLLSNLKETRFRQVSDFYSLVVLCERLDSRGSAFASSRPRRLAGEVLTAFSVGVEQVRQRARSFEGAKPDESLYREYAMTVAEGTDSLSHRRQRETILRALIEPILERRDDRRGFTPEQRRLLWATAEERRCVECGRRLTWEDFTIDHVRPHSKGGRTELKNAAIMCSKHNSAKGNRRRRRAGKRWRP